MPRVHLFATAVLALAGACFVAAFAAPLAAQTPAAPAAPPKASATRQVMPPKKPAALALQQKKAAAQQKTALAAQPKKPSAAAPEAKKSDFSDYFRVWGVSGDTTRADIVARFGEPARVGDWASKPFYYFNDTLRFFFSSDDTVSTMIVGNSFEAMPAKAIPPDILAKAFIGKTRNDVLKAFGPANSVSSDNLRYWPRSGVYKVEFQCYDFDRYVCKQMLVQF